jgi:hypothetical protein
MRKLHTFRGYGPKFRSNLVTLIQKFRKMTKKITHVCFADGITEEIRQRLNFFHYDGLHMTSFAKSKITEVSHDEAALLTPKVFICQQDA